MADYVDGAFAYLQAWVDTFMQHYAPGISAKLQRFGKTTRFMVTSRRQLNGSNIEYEVQGRQNRSTRATKDLMAPTPAGRPGAYIRFNVNFDHTDSSNNDFIALEIGFQTTIWDVWKQSDSLFKGEGSTIERDIQEGMDDVKETFTRYLFLPSDGQMAVVNDKNDADEDIWPNTSAYSAGSEAAMFKLDPVSIARIQIGAYIEFRNAAGDLIVNHVEVTDVDPFETTITGKITDDSVDNAGSTVTDLDSVAADHIVYMHGNYNVAPSGTLDGYFDPDVAFYGRDRKTDPYRILMPRRYDPAASAGVASVDLTADMYTRMGEYVGWTAGNSNAQRRRAIIMSRNEYRGTTKFSKDEGITVVPALESQVGRGLNRAFGHDGFVLHDPNLGTVAMVVEDFAAYGEINFLELENWEVATPISGGFRMLPGQMAGIWRQEGETDGSGRVSKRFSAQGIDTFAFVPTWPKNDARLEGLKTNY